MSDPILRASLQAPLDSFALDVAFTAHRRVTGVFGPSGSGKTTLLESIAGLRPKTKGLINCLGSAWLNTNSQINRPPEARGVGYVPQDHLLFPHRSVAKNLAFGSRRAARTGSDVSSIRRDVVNVLELDALLARNVETLSGGERQRVALGRALCSGPQLLLLDEPLASLDAQLRRKILPFLLKIRDRFQVPIFIVSHNPVELLALCDEVIALRAGRVIAQGTPTEIFTRPDVYPDAAHEGFENILPGAILAHGPHTTRVRVGPRGDGQVVSLGRIDLAPGELVSLGIPAGDILISTSAVTGLSARNALAATIVSVNMIEHAQILTAKLEQPDSPVLVVELTTDAVEELSLAPGRSIWLVIKSSSISVFG